MTDRQQKVMDFLHGYFGEAIVTKKEITKVVVAHLGDDFSNWKSDQHWFTADCRGVPKPVYAARRSLP